MVRATPGGSCRLVANDTETMTRSATGTVTAAGWANTDPSQPLVGPRLRYNERGRPYGWLTQRAYWMLSTTAICAWPTYATTRGLTVHRHHSWIYWDTRQGLPPRIDSLTRIRLPSSLVPVNDGIGLLPPS